MYSLIIIFVISIIAAIISFFVIKEDKDGKNEKMKNAFWICGASILAGLSIMYLVSTIYYDTTKDDFEKANYVLENTIQIKEVSKTGLVVIDKEGIPMKYDVRTKDYCVISSNGNSCIKIYHQTDENKLVEKFLLCSDNIKYVIELNDEDKEAFSAEY